MDKSDISVKETYYYGFITLLGLLLIFVLIPLGVQSGEPRLFPYIYSAALVVVGGGKLVHMMITKQTEQYHFNRKVLKYVGLSILLFFVYAFLVQYIGFFIMSILFILAFLLYLGESWKLAIVLCLVLPGSIYLLFTRLLNLYFPSGIMF
ncbi:tripartite tricarboxylate transporter TctB family protein [Salicibibacter kimchii]|nr:tripartite tricarboxylate transporter TctB family protein [Salicibibacter kimchii]